jgi:protein arginine kinase
MDERKVQMNQIAMSSRIRLARNIKGFCFPQRADEATLQLVAEKVTDVFLQSEDMASDFEIITMSKISPLERHFLKEKHVISPEYARQSLGRVLVRSRDGRISIMVNEEDHLRIQCMLPGFQLQDVWDCATKIDDVIEKQLDYAFHQEYGYLTSCPTNVGTGMRASVMLHLPALVISRNAWGIFQAISGLGVAVRGMYGEGSEIVGNIFQVSNQVTLGMSESDIIVKLESVVNQIIAKEIECREALLSEDATKLEDRAWRSYGLLTQARLMPSSEALQLLSDVRLGQDLGIIDGIGEEVLQGMLDSLGPASMRKLSGGHLKPDERDRFRATWIRDTLAGLDKGGKDSV